MCGILGGNAFADERHFLDGLKSIIHRGTDASRYVSLPDDYYLGHNRLSIQDLSENSHQPMVSSCGRYYLAFNGELWESSFRKYNKPLREKYDFKTEKSDTELLLYFLIEYQENLEVELRSLEGMFAFAFYDSEKKITRLSRDFMGRIPFYYYHEADKFAYCSEAKGLTQSIDDAKFFRTKRNSPKEEKLQEKIRLVKPGTLMTYSPDGNLFLSGYAEETTTWLSFKDKDCEDFLYVKTEEDLEKITLPDLGIDHYTEEFKRRLRKSVEDELIADVPVCTILSGGVDSTIITHILKEMKPDIEAFVVHIGEESNGNDDLHYARIAAKHFGIKLNEVIVTNEMIEGCLEETVWAVEHYDWRQISCSVAMLFLSKAIREKGYKVVFGGEGSDEIFASYNDVKRWSWRDPLDYHQKRVNLIHKLHEGNCIRVNTSMMYGGEVELRAPFMGKDVVRYGLTLPVRYRSDRDGKGSRMKYLLRRAYENEVNNDDLIWRPKITMQIGCHTDYLKEDKWQSMLKGLFVKLFQERDVPARLLGRTFRDPDLIVEPERV